MLQRRAPISRGKPCAHILLQDRDGARRQGWVPEHLDLAEEGVGVDVQDDLVFLLLLVVLLLLLLAVGGCHRHAARGAAAARSAAAAAARAARGGAPCGVGAAPTPLHMSRFSDP